MFYCTLLLLFFIIKQRLTRHDVSVVKQRIAGANLVFQ